MNANCDVFQGLNYNGFFLEGACYVLIFDMLQNKRSAYKNLPWIHSGLHCLRTIMEESERSGGQYPVIIAAIEQMIRTVFPDVDLRDSSRTGPSSHIQDLRDERPPEPGSLALASEQTPPASRIETGQQPTPAWIYPSMPFGSDVPRSSAMPSPAPGFREDPQMDFSADDVGWDIDFGSTDMEAFLSLDPSRAFGFEF